MDQINEQNNLVIEMDSVDLDFGNGTGIFDVSLDLEPGTILGLIGPSGCGKTTLIRVLAGLAAPTDGLVRVFGKEPAGFDERDKLRIGYVPQHMILDAHLTTEENLYIVGGMYGLSPLEQKDRIARQLDFVDLAEARKRLVKNLSGGMQRRLMLAGGLLHQPALIFADEPTAGLDPILREQIWESFRKLRDDGRTLVAATQFISEAVYCDRVALMRAGRILTVDTPEGLRRQAAGGEVIYIQVNASDVFRAMDFIDHLEPVRKVEMAEDDPGGIRVVVDHASGYLPDLLTALKQEGGITPSVAEPRQLRMDKVFVRLVQRLGQDEADQDD